MLKDPSENWVASIPISRLALWIEDLGMDSVILKCGLWTSVWRTLLLVSNKINIVTEEAQERIIAILQSYFMFVKPIKII